MTIQLDRPADRTSRVFQRALHGDFIEPSDPRYDAARAVWSASFDRRPAAIVRAADVADVVRTVVFARDSDLPLAVRSGGHSFAGHGTADEAVVLDLRALNTIGIDPARRVARAGAGMTAGSYTTAAHAYGLATPFGDTASVGLSGITLGGGIGYLTRLHGLTVDSLLSADVVTADGRFVTASADEHPDLFWALRGGGGNFGVVTSLEYRLHPVGTVYGGALVQPATRNLLRIVGPLAATAPEELTTIATVMAAPAAPFIPAAEVGKLALVTLGVHVGDPAAGARVLAPFRALARPIADTFGPIPYPAIYAYTEAGSRPGLRSAGRSLFLDVIDDTIVDTVLGFMERATSPAAMVQLRVLGGAMGRVDASRTAFAHRDRPFMLTIITPFVGPAGDDQHLAWTESFFAALRPHGSGVYVNFLADEGPARIHQAYPDATYRHLAEVKRTWDPDNFFRINHNVLPA